MQYNVRIVFFSITTVTAELSACLKIASCPIQTVKCHVRCIVKPKLYLKHFNNTAHATVFSFEMVVHQLMKKVTLKIPES